MNGIQEVMGSTPTVSIRKQTGILPVCFFFMCAKGISGFEEGLKA